MFSCGQIRQPARDGRVLLRRLPISGQNSYLIRRGPAPTPATAADLALANAREDTHPSHPQASLPSTPLGSRHQGPPPAGESRPASIKRNRTSDERGKKNLVSKSRSRGNAMPRQRIIEPSFQPSMPHRHLDHCRKDAALKETGQEVGPYIPGRAPKFALRSMNHGFPEAVVVVAGPSICGFGPAARGRMERRHFLGRLLRPL